MFEYLHSYKKIVVTGPQRSGTTLIARAIAYDLSREYVDEQAFIATDYLRWRQEMDKQRSFVMQAPGMCRYVHEYGDDDTVAVVLCRRNVEDIVASQERIGWKHEAYELSLYGLTPQDGRRIADVKYEFWEQHQQAKIFNSFVVEYEDLEEHPLWIPKAKRANFGPRQWQMSYA